MLMYTNRFTSACMTVLVPVHLCTVICVCENVCVYGNIKLYQTVRR